MRVHLLKSMASGHLKIKKGLVEDLYWLLPVTLLRVYCKTKYSRRKFQIIEEKFQGVFSFHENCKIYFAQYTVIFVNLDFKRSSMVYNTMERNSKK